jgi:hypothetical protein
MFHFSIFRIGGVNDSNVGANQQISSNFISSIWSSNQTPGHRTDIDIMIFWVMVLFSW